MVKSLAKTVEKEIALLQTTHAKAMRLLSHALSVANSHSNWQTVAQTEFPKIKDGRIIAEALKQAFEEHPYGSQSPEPELRAGFLIASKYGKLEELIKQVKREKTQGDTGVGGQFSPSSFDDAYWAKVILVKDILVPQGRNEEALEQLNILAKHGPHRTIDDQLKIALRISPERFIEFSLTQEHREQFSRALSYAETSPELKQRLQKAHVAKLVKTGQLPAAVYVATEYKFTIEEIKGLKDKCLDKVLASAKKGKFDYSFAASSINLCVPEQEQHEYWARILSDLEAQGELPEAGFTIARNARNYQIAFAQGMKHLAGLVGDARRTVEDTIEQEILDNLKDPEKIKTYISEHKLDKYDEAHGLAIKFNLAAWLIDEYERKKEYALAANLAEGQGEKERAKNLYVKAKDFHTALRLTEDATEKIDLHLREAKQECKQDAYLGTVLDDIRSAIQLSACTPNVSNVKKAGIDILVKAGLYSQAVLFAKELGVKVSPKILRDAIIHYEQNGDFADCAVVSQAQGNEEKTQLYYSMAERYGQEVPELPQSQIRLATR